MLLKFLSQLNLQGSKSLRDCKQLFIIPISLLGEFVNGRLHRVHMGIVPLNSTKAPNDADVKAR